MYGDNYLAHYGKKGMKWGIRRERMQRARLGAKMENYNNKLGRQVLKAERKRASMEPGGEKEARQVEEISKLVNAMLITGNFRERTIRGLSEKEINRGRRQFKTLNLLGLTTP